MAKETKTATDTMILTEHDRIMRVRHILAIVNFVTILLGTLITLFLTNRKGISTALHVHLLILLGINILQILVSIADGLTKILFGIYIKWITFVSWGIGGAWLAATISELITGIGTLGSFRRDLITITGVQLLTALMVYIVWPSLEKWAIDSLTGKKNREDKEKRRKKARGYVRSYILVCIALFLAQGGALFAYKIPPRVYDIFDETRALRYELNSAKDGYIVTGVYLGTSNVVCVPATYNNLPVVGISSGAISDVGLLAKNNINEIIIGTEESDENGETRLVSNLQFISANAIQNNNIVKITIPHSVTSISGDAIQSSSLEEIKYEAAADFSMSAFKCENLESVVLTGKGVGNIRDLDGIGNTTIVVEKDIYNMYRETNYQYADNFRPNIEDEEICIDFYTDCDYYIDSIFAKKSEGYRLSMEDLKQSEFGRGLDIDTKAYAANALEIGTDGIKKNSAFRGWYRDPEFNTEFKFAEDNSIRVNESMKLYAKWLPEYTATLDWGTFTPTNAETGMLWTDDVPATFPVVENRAGYDGITWKKVDGGEVLTNSVGIRENLKLKGEWTLTAPTVILSTNKDTTEDGTIFYEYNGAYSKRFTYEDDENGQVRTLTITANATHALENAAPVNDQQFVFSYEWVLNESASNVTRTRSKMVQNVADSGTYTVKVTAKSPWGESATKTLTYYVQIDQKDLNVVLNNCSSQFLNATPEYSGVMQTNTVTNEEQLRAKSVSVLYEYVNKATNAKSTNGVTNVGEYSVTATYVKIDNTGKADNNYTTISQTVDFTITPLKLTSNGKWYIDGDQAINGNEVIYDGQNHTYQLAFSGIINQDTVNLQYTTTNDAKNVGTKVTTLVGVDNPNYTIEGIGESMRQASWKITQRPIAVASWRLDGKTNLTETYTGKEMTVTVGFRTNDIVAGDEVVASFKSEGVTTAKAKNAGTYTACVNGLSGSSSQNYKLDLDSYEETWSITQRPITISFTNPTLVYNSAEQGVTATLEGIVPEDLNSFNKESFIYENTDPTGTLSYGATSSGTQLQVNFTAVNANVENECYSVKIKALNTADEITKNYSITAKEQTFTIAPKTISFAISSASTGLTYNGDDQNLVLDISGIETSDLNKISAEKFTEKDSKAFEGQKSGNKYQLVFTGKDAGMYSVAISAFDNTNYVIDTNTSSKTFAIGKKTLSVVWQITDLSDENPEAKPLKSIAEYTYNYYGYQLSPSIQGVQGEDVIILDVENPEYKAVNSNGYVTTATLPAAYTNNYEMATSTAEWKITPKTLDVSWSPKTLDGTTTNGKITFTYDATQKEVVPSVVTLGDEDVVLVSEGTQQTSANVKDDDAYQASVTGLSGEDAGNYVLNDDTTAIQWVINRKTVTLTWINTEFTYDGQPHRAEAVVSGTCGEDSVYAVYGEGKVAYASQTHKSTVYGLSGTGAENYQLPSNKEMTFVINRKTVSLTWGISEFTYDRQAHRAEVTIGDICEGDSVDPIYGENPVVNAGDNYTSTVVGLSNTNYKLPENKSQSFTINKKQVSVTSWSTTALEYNGSKQSVVANFDGVCAGDDLEVQYSGNEQKNTNQYSSNEYYTALVDALGNTNYELDRSNGKDSINWKISPRTIGISWYNTSKAYTGSEQTMEAYVSDVYSNDVVNLVYEGNKATDVNLSGEYTATITGLSGSSAKNYQLPETDTSTEWNITPLTVYLNWSDLGHVYDGTEFVVTAELTNVCAADKGKVAPVYGEHSATNAGSNYTATVTGLDGDRAFNYTLTSYNSTGYTISPRPITVEWSGAQTVTYDGNEHSLTATVSNCVNDDIVTVTAYSLARTSSYGQSNGSLNGTDQAGVYTIRVAGIEDASGNYTVANPAPAAVLTINQQPVTITWSETREFTYDNQAHGVTATVQGVNQEQIVAVAFTYTSSNTATNAGTYYDVGIKLGNYNYCLPGDYQPISFTISRRPVYVAEWSESEFTYNGEYQTVTVTLDNVVSGVGAGIQYSSNSQINAGEYTASVTLSNQNYILQGSNKHTWKILQKEVFVESWEETAVTYYDGKSHSVKANLFDVNGVKLTPEYATDCVPTAINAGTYSATVTGIKGNTNYKLIVNPDNPNSNTTTWTIGQRPISVSSWNGTKVTYDRSPHSVEAKLIGVNGEEVTPEYSYESNYTYTAINAGIYHAKVIGIKDNSNYKYDEKSNSEIEWVIDQRQVSLNWSTTSLISLPYNGEPQIITATVGNICNGDIVTLSYSNHQQTDVGSYEATVTSISNNNYKLPSITTKAWKITAKPVTFEATGTSFVYDGTIKQPTFSTSDLTGTDGVELVFDTTKGTTLATDVNSYTAYVKLSGEKSGNYTLSNTGFSWNITAKPVTFKVAATSFEYDGTVKQPVISTDDFIGTDDVELVFDTSKGTNSATDVNGYTAYVKLSGSKSGNYTISSKNFSWYITAKTVTFNATGISFEYDGTVKQPTFNPIGLTGTDGVQLVLDSNNGTISATNVGNYNANVKLSGSKSGNYTLSKAGISWEITAKSVTFNATATSFVYDGTQKQPTFNTSGLTGTDGVALVLDTSRGTSYATDAKSGTYTAYVKLSGPSDKLGNYTLPSNTSFNWTISAKSVTFEATTSFTYDGNVKQPVISTSDLVGAQGVTLVFDTTKGTSSATNAGTYTAYVKLSGWNSSNYTISSNTTFNWTIEAKALTINWGGAETEGIDFDGNNHKPTVFFEDGSGNPVTLITPVVYVNNDTGATVVAPGTYTVAVTVPSAEQNNYSISGNTSIIITINRIEPDVTITMPEEQLVANGTDLSGEFGATLNNKSDLDVELVTIFYRLDDNGKYVYVDEVVEAGSYKFVIALTGTQENGFTAYNAVRTFTVKPAPVVEPEPEIEEPEVELPEVVGPEIQIPDPISQAA